MATLFIVSILAGIAWGIVWSLLDGFCIRKGILVGTGPNMMLVGMLRSILTCFVAGIPVGLLLGTTGGLFGVIIALVTKMAMERRLF